jgi:hypothetical protein
MMMMMTAATTMMMMTATTTTICRPASLRRPSRMAWTSNRRLRLIRSPARIT